MHHLRRIDKHFELNNTRAFHYDTSDLLNLGVVRVRMEMSKDSVREIANTPELQNAMTNLC